MAARSPTSATFTLYAFGNTEERYRIKILGCKGKGTLGVDRPFNHATKVGSVK